MKLRSLLSATALLSLLAPAARAIQLDISAFDWRVPITVSGYAGSETLADFPVLVTLAEGVPSGFSYDDCAEDGADLRFADEGGATLFHEIETWDPDGTSYVWVKVPSLSGMSTVLNLFYGADTNTLSAVDPTGVWTRYAAVFHGGAAIVDATGHAPAVTPNGATTATIGGMAGGVMTKGSATGVTFSNPITSRALSSIDRFSFSGWFKKSGGTSAVLASNKGKDEWAKNGFVALVEGGNYFSVGVGVNNAGAHQPSTNTGKGKLENGKWGHLAFSYDKSTTSLSSYFNGAGIFSTTSARNILDPGKSVWAFGGFFDGNKNCFQGDMDEIRILNGTASADWIQAEYDSVADPAAFAVLGAAVPVNLGTPRISAPVVERRQDGSFLVTAEVSENEPVAGSVVCVVGGTSFPMTTSDASLPATYSAIVSGVPAGTYVATVQAQAAGGTVVSRTAATPFHAGALVVTGVADADEASLSPGMFRIARADADPAGLPAISFDIAFSGPGLAAVVAPTVATLTIPAGEASVDVTVTPVYTTAVDADATLALAVSGAFVGTPSSGLITIVNATYDPAVRYVATTGDDANNGGTPESPKKTIGAAVDSLASISQTLPCTVHVAPGLYPISNPIVVTNAISVIGDAPDPSRVIVSNTVSSGNASQEHRVFIIANAGALVANLTMQKGEAYNRNGGNFNIGTAGGMVSNCVVEAGYARDNGKAAGAWLDAGVVTHSVFRKNYSNSASVNWEGNRAGLLQLNGQARAENCLFTENNQTKAVTLINLGGSSVMRNCTIADSSLSATNGYCKAWSTLNIASGATVQNVVIAGVTNTIDGAACPPTGSVEKFLNGAFDGDATGLPAGTVTGTAALFFRNYASEDYAVKYQPKPGGPLYDKGANYTPMAAFDLSGAQKRKIGSHVDIGCYEGNAAATVIIVK